MKSLVSFETWQLWQHALATKPKEIELIPYWHCPRSVPFWNNSGQHVYQGHGLEHPSGVFSLVILKRARNSKPRYIIAIDDESVSSPDSNIKTKLETLGIAYISLPNTSNLEVIEHALKSPTVNLRALEKNFSRASHRFYTDASELAPKYGLTILSEVAYAELGFEDTQSEGQLKPGERRLDHLVATEAPYCYPLLAVEIDGHFHRDEPKTKRSDHVKETLCREHGFPLLRIAVGDDIDNDHSKITGRSKRESRKAIDDLIAACVVVSMKVAKAKSQEWGYFNALLNEVNAISNDVPDSKGKALKCLATRAVRWAQPLRSRETSLLEEIKSLNEDGERERSAGSWGDSGHAEWMEKQQEWESLELNKIYAPDQPIDEWYQFSSKTERTGNALVLRVTARPWRGLNHPKLKTYFWETPPYQLRVIGHTGISNEVNQRLLSTFTAQIQREFEQIIRRDHPKYKDRSYRNKLMDEQFWVEIKKAFSKLTDINEAEKFLLRFIRDPNDYVPCQGKPSYVVTKPRVGKPSDERGVPRDRLLRKAIKGFESALKLINIAGHQFSEEDRAILLESCRDRLDSWSST